MPPRLVPESLFAGEFRVIEPIGRGGMGEVYLVEQVSTGARRALKLLLPHLAADPEARERFEREAKVGARIQSDHIVQVIAAGIDEPSGTPWLAMELLEGESLARRLARAPLRRGEAAKLFAQLGHALGAAHDAGVVHRDLKPENLHVGIRRRAGEEILLKVLDFGLAKFVLEAGSNETAPMGTLAWMAPEQTEHGAVGPPADVWSVGLIAFWALVGKPFWRAAREGGSVPILMREILLDPIGAASARAGELGASLPDGFDGWFARAVVRDPAARFRDGRAACDALVALLDGGASESSARSAGAAGADTIATAPTQASGDVLRAAAKLARNESEAGGRGAVRLIALFVVVVAGVALLTFAARRGLRGDVAATSSSAAAPPASASAPAPSATAITALPPPRCESRPALGLYAAALQAMRDANWAHAEERLHEAEKLDPGCALIQLRLVQATQGGKEQREHYQRAVEGRSQLSPRDLTLLGIWEPSTREPPAPDEAISRMRRAAAAFPTDAEFLDHLCAYERETEAAVAACRRATELDPQYADAWSDLGLHLSRLKRDDEALVALDRCVAISPTPGDCLARRASIYFERGECAKAEADRRAVVTANPTSLEARQDWVESLIASGAPPEAIGAAQAEAIALVPRDRPFAIAFATATAALARRDYPAAEKAFEDAERALGDGADADDRERVAFVHVARLLDSGRNAEASSLAGDFLKRRRGWDTRRSSRVEPLLFYARFRGGAISRGEFETLRTDWQARIREDLPDLEGWALWSTSYCPAGLDDPEEAARALAAAPGTPPAPAFLYRLATVEVAADHFEEGRRLFEQLRASCAWRHVLEDSESYARALENTGAVEQACAIYRRIATSTIRRERARARLAKLSCK